jgi:hypothetical protein
MSVLLFAILVLDIILLYQQRTASVVELSIYSWTKAFPYFNILIDILLLTGVLRYRIEIYSWIAARAVISVIQIVVLNVISSQTVDVLIWIVLLLVVISFLLGLFLGVKLCPPRVPKEIEVDIDGVEKIKKTVYVFPD